MARKMLTAILMLAVLTVVTGMAYPLAVTGLAWALFPYQAAGSLLCRDGQVVGSALIGQGFADAGYFHGRPSAAGQRGYDASSSAGSNLGPTNKELVAAVQRRLTYVRAENGLPPDAPVPSDMVMASGSGLDPHISPAAAYLQVPRVARARDLPEETVRALVSRMVEGRQFDILGEPRVNVLKLNLELDKLSCDRR